MAVKFQKVVFQNSAHLTKVEYSLIIHTNTRDLKKTILLHICNDLVEQCEKKVIIL